MTRQWESCMSRRFVDSRSGIDERKVQRIGGEGKAVVVVLMRLEARCWKCISRRSQLSEWRREKAKRVRGREG